MRTDRAFYLHDRRNILFLHQQLDITTPLVTPTNASGTNITSRIIKLCINITEIRAAIIPTVSIKWTAF